jgi:hypothetical protein
MNTPKFNLIAGAHYQVLNTKFSNSGGMISCDSTHEFVKSFPCYDVRHHGVGNPNDYIMYIFKLPKQFGQVSFYQFQITEVILKENT